ncbi:hypothetical protein DI09_46p160 [Mitosporidium daphniae]|uniref:Uncharacterized protein n=1 Tax=Mitosporidium daphniae TaxID=1485682 RepID=A0A098VTL6_9MICR|nr:uncharacterized protein DI09_46p160 [Mitosporidium daphniae]KGG51066.1 hypothetical protein DI09_46p160 [Mitosporidium daphniae]|eukprot:XP_013237493.1 uncharacterized protein DI09_46p160 [Mitosporidium daphniae]
MAIARNSATKNDSRKRSPKSTDAKNSAEKKSKSTKKTAGKDRSINKYLDEEWQKDLLPLILEKYPSPPKDMVSFKALIELSSFQAISKTIIESLLPDELMDRIPGLLSEIFEALIDYRWNKLWKHGYNISSSECRKRLSNEQVFSAFK